MSPGRSPGRPVGRCRRVDRRGLVGRCHRVDCLVVRVGRCRPAITGLARAADVAGSIATRPPGRPISPGRLPGCPGRPISAPPPGRPAKSTRCRLPGRPPRKSSLGRFGKNAAAAPPASAPPANAAAWVAGSRCRAACGSIAATGGDRGSFASRDRRAAAAGRQCSCTGSRPTPGEFRCPDEPVAGRPAPGRGAAWATAGVVHRPGDCRRLPGRRARRRQIAVAWPSA